MSREDAIRRIPVADPGDAEGSIALADDVRETVLVLGLRDGRGRNCRLDPNGAVEEGTVSLGEAEGELSVHGLDADHRIAGSTNGAMSCLM